MKDTNIITNVEEYTKYVTELKQFYSHTFDPMENNSNTRTWLCDNSELRDCKQWHNCKIRKQFTKNSCSLNKINRTYTDFKPKKDAYVSNELSFFFRGQFDYNFKLVSGIFRKIDKTNGYVYSTNKGVNNEAKIMNEVLSERPDRFSNCKTMFEKLTIMQHYTIPTRIMDISGNPLIALYFACEDVVDNPNTKTNGAVFLFSNKVENNLNFNSDKLRLLSNLSLIENFNYCQNYENGYNSIFNLILKAFYLYLLEVLDEQDNRDVYLLIQEININKPQTIYSARDKLDNIIILKSKSSNKMNCTITRDTKLHIYTFIDVILKLKNNIHLSENYLGSVLPSMATKKWIQLTPSTIIYNIIDHMAAYVDHDEMVKKVKKKNSTILNLYNYALKFNNASPCSYCNLPKSQCKDKLLNILREEKPHFDDRIIKSQLNKWYIIKSLKNNQRIHQQDGHFIITPKPEDIDPIFKHFTIDNIEFNKYGVEKIKTSRGFYPNTYEGFKNKSALFHKLYNISLQSEPFIHKIKIPHSVKKDIIQQLDSIGINHSTIYPELHEFAKYVKNKYS